MLESECSWVEALATLFSSFQTEAFEVIPGRLVMSSLLEVSEWILDSTLLGMPRREIPIGCDAGRPKGPERASPMRSLTGVMSKASTWSPRSMAPAISDTR